eukprot:7651693-Karenia_brevis.AAC.1
MFENSWGRLKAPGGVWKLPGYVWKLPGNVWQLFLGTSGRFPGDLWKLLRPSGSSLGPSEH